MEQQPKNEALLPTSAPTSPAARNAVQLVDVAERHIRRPGDLLFAVVTVLAMAIVLALALIGPQTAAGVTQDVQEVLDRNLRQILLLPVTIIGSLVFVTVPIAVLLAQLYRRRWRVLVKAVAAAALAYLIAFIAVSGLALLEPTNPLNLALTLNFRGAQVEPLADLVSAITALLTAVGQRSSSRLIRASWFAVLFVMGLAVLQGVQSLTGAIVSVMLGQAVGFLVRFLVGVRSTRAAGLALVGGLRRAGIDPELIVRLDAESAAAESWLVSSHQPIGYSAQSALLTPPANGEPDEAPPARSASSLTELWRMLREGDDVVVRNPLPLPPQVKEALAEGHHGGTEFRRYAVFEGDRRVDVAVLDGDKQVVGMLANLWDSLRLRGLNKAVKSNLREAAEHAVLLNLSARSAGVRAPAIMGVAQAADSMLVVHDHVPLQTFAALTGEQITDEAVDSAWEQLAIAHNAGITHRALGPSQVAVGESGKVWILGWHNGEIAANELSPRLDMAQLLTMLSAKVGISRAIASAARNLSESEISLLAPLLQLIVLPRETRAEIKHARKILAQLRAELARLVPTVAEAPAVTLQRVTLRQVLTISVAFAAILVLFGTFNWDEVAAAFGSADPVFLAAAYGVGLLAYVGSAIGLTSFTPEKLGFWRPLLVQAASSIVSLVAPAGIGPAAIDLRYITKQGVETKLAVATVSLIQVTRFISTLGFLIFMMIFAGAGGSADSLLPSGTAIVWTVLVLIVLAVVMALPPIRAALTRRFGPMLRQTWPRIVWVLGNPRRLAVGFFGNLLQVICYVGAFGLTLAAFGYSLPVATLAITYLASSSAGSIVPSPAGVGPVELALTSGLTIAGIPGAVAVSVVLVFRVLTLWLRIPLGWLALRYLQSRNAL